MKKMKRTLALFLALILVFGLVGCAKEATPAPSKPSEEATSSTEKAPEATQTPEQPTEQAPAAADVPYLADRIASGELPAMADRLPKSPLVVEVNEVGTYGGNINRAYTGASDFRNLLYGCCVWEPLVSLDSEGGAHPNLLESWEYSGENSTVLTLKLHEGIKWSDGAPFTSEDIAYFMDLYMTGEVSIEANGLQTYVEEVEVVDEYTVILYLSSYYNLIDGATYEPIYGPSHYLKQFDPRENPSASWADMNNALCNATISTAIEDLPVLTPWKVTSYTENGLMIAERNPYYFKVDQAGNQLPYVDTITYQYVADAGSIAAMAVNGEIDFQSRSLSFSDYAYYKQNEAAGRYVVKALTSSSLACCMRLNYAVENENLRELYRNLDFRIALSQAIDREAISDAVFFGLAEPWGDYPISSSEYYENESYAKLYTEYKPEESKAALAALGVTDSDGDGFVDYKGEKVTMVIDGENGNGTGPLGVVDMVAEYWRALGIDVIVNIVDRSLLLSSWEENTHSVLAWVLGGASNPVVHNYAWAVLSPANYYWHNSGVPMQLWWHTDGAEGVEPPEFIKELNKTMETAISAIDPAERLKAGQAACRITAENLFVIPTTTAVELCIVNDGLKNVPDSWVSGNEYLGERVSEPWTFFYAE